MFLRKVEVQCTNYKEEKKYCVRKCCLKSKLTQRKMFKFKFKIVSEEENSIKDNQKRNFDIKDEKHPSNLKKGSFERTWHMRK